MKLPTGLIIALLVAVSVCPARGAAAGPRIVNIRNGDVLSGVVTVEVAARPGQQLILLLGDESEQPAAVGEAPARGAGPVLVPLSVWTNFLDNGAYRLVVQDFAGHADARRVTIRNGVQEVRVLREDLPISLLDLPLTGEDADRINHGMISGYVAPLNTRRFWKINIVNCRGRTVRTFRGLSDSMDVFWHGEDAHGHVVPDGDYEALTTTPKGTFPTCVIRKRTSPAATPPPQSPAFAAGLRIPGHPRWRGAFGRLRRKCHHAASLTRLSCTLCG